MEGFKIDSIGYVGEKVKSEGKSRKEGQGEERTGRKKSKIGGNNQGLRVPPPGAYAYHCLQ